ncbi:MAG: hypothetical protein AAF743_10940, partial [Planctomycetota bacterium]
SLLGATVDSQNRPVLTGGFSFNFGSAPVARFTDTGLPDTSFSDDGAALNVPFGILPGLFDVAVDAGDRPVAVGSSRGQFTEVGLNQDFPIVSRWLADGTPDPDFGIDGTVTIDTDLQFARLRSVAVLPNGEIIAAGEARDPNTPGNPQVAFVTRVSAAGVVLQPPTPLPIPANLPTFTDILPLSDGTFLLSGFDIQSPSPNGFSFLVKLDASGTPVSSYGVDGVLEIDTPVVTDAGVARLLPDPSGIFVVGNGRQPNGDRSNTVNILRLTPTGDIDASFGSGGYRIIQPSEDNDLLRDAISIGGSEQEPAELVVLLNRREGGEQSVLLRIDADNPVEELETQTDIFGSQLLDVGGGRVAVVGRLGGDYASFAVQLGQSQNLVGTSFDAEQAAVLALEFDGPVTLVGVTFDVISLGPLSVDPADFVAAADGNTLTFTYAPNGVVTPLPSGNFEATVAGITGFPVLVRFNFQAGDLDGDFDVDLTDAALLERNFGRTDDPVYTQGDLDYDGDVDLTDAALLERNFGASLVPFESGGARLFAGGPKSLFGGPLFDDDEDGRGFSGLADRPRGRRGLLR